VKAVPLHFAANVFLDTASAHRWEVLNEHVFVRRVVEALRIELGARFDALKVFVFSPARATTRPASADLDVPGKILIFLSDESSSIPHALAGAYDAIFKAYLPRDLPGTNIFAFNVGYVGGSDALPPTPVLERAVDVFFSGNLNANRFALYQAFHPMLKRLPGLDRRLARLATASPVKHALRRNFSADETGFRRHVYFTDGFKAGLAPEGYAKMLAGSKIVLCPRGFASAETFRHVEALRAGAIVASEPLPDTHLYRGAPILRVDDWRTGLTRLRALANDPEALVDLQRQSRAWYDNHLSEAATARFMAQAFTGEGLSAGRGLL
jgi:hypothetical protein